LTLAQNAKKMKLIEISKRGPDFLSN